MKIASLSRLFLNPIPALYRENSATIDIGNSPHKFNCEVNKDSLETFTRNSSSTKFSDMINRTNEASIRLYTESYSSLDVSCSLIGENQVGNHNEPSDSGRTRSSTRRANQTNSGNESNSNKATSVPDKQTSSGKGKKRKKKRAGDDASGSDSDEGSAKSKLCVEAVKDNEEPICSCPKDVMKCIGILPSLPIVSHFYESDDSISSLNEDLSYTVLPMVSRNRRDGGDDH